MSFQFNSSGNRNFARRQESYRYRDSLPTIGLFSVRSRLDRQDTIHPNIPVRGMDSATRRSQSLHDLAWSADRAADVYAQRSQRVMQRMDEQLHESQEKIRRLDQAEHRFLASNQAAAPHYRPHFRAQDSLQQFSTAYQQQYPALPDLRHGNHALNRYTNKWGINSQVYR